MRTQDQLIEDLKHAHAHSYNVLCEIAHEAHAEIARLQRELRAEQRKPLWKRILGR